MDLGEKRAVKILKFEHHYWSKDREINGLYVIGPGGNGDLWTNLFKYIIHHKIDDWWAHYAVNNAFHWMEQGKRWSEYAEKYIGDTLHTVDHMTQDPWLYGWCCAVHLHRYDLIDDHRPTVRMLPDKIAFRRALLDKCNTWNAWRNSTRWIPKQDFVEVFYQYMDNAIYIHSKRK